MKKYTALFVLSLTLISSRPITVSTAWIRINQLGYIPGGTKVAVWCSNQKQDVTKFQILNATSWKIVFEGQSITSFGTYGPFTQTYRIDFSDFQRPGRYFLRAGKVSYPVFEIGENVYKGAADFCLRYMRQQRSGFNPYLKDSCHTQDGYSMYGPMADSTHIDVSGGWHDASDYLQYATTSANATYHLLAAYRDFPTAFSDQYKANGLPGSNGQLDVLDEAKWGLEWLLKMHPRADLMFNQIGDDRDHKAMRIPKEDDYYGKGFERPVYFCTGEPQGLGRYKNRSTGVASTAGKFSSAFSLGYRMMKNTDNEFANKLAQPAISAYEFGLKKPGVCQTASCLSPYFYEEDNWVDDMELAAAELSHLKTSKASEDYLESAYRFAYQEKVTPWLGTDTARHYQWYPFINIGHYELAKQIEPQRQKEILGYYKRGIDSVWQKAKQNAFYRGIPFIWCSNNLTVSFATQCYWYRMLSGDSQYMQLEQASFDWLFGCNPWGTSFVYGWPAKGDTPTDPHSAFTHIKKYPIDGGLVDGPVFASIYSQLIGITLAEPDEYAEFQSGLVVYHDDYGDYSTNEPTLDGTASLIYLLAAKEVRIPTDHGKE